MCREEASDNGVHYGILFSFFFVADNRFHFSRIAGTGRRQIELKPIFKCKWAKVCPYQRLN